VLRMEKAKEQRAEKRLRYRWHARFALNPKQKPLSGQMVDVSSKGMALLYHNDKSCPGTDQLITTNFGVPYFDTGDSFDTVLFNRIGRVCRIDNLTSKVNRIAIQFVEPLFFKPGEQNISDSDAKQRLEAKAQLIINMKEKPVPSASSGQALSGAEGAGTKTQAKVKTENKAKFNAEESTGLYSEALARAEERIRSYAEAKEQAEAKLKAEIEARHRNEKKLLVDFEKKIRSYAEAKARAEEKAKAETKARAKAEAKAKSEARLRAKAEKKAQAEAEKRAKIEAELQKKTDLYAEQLAKIKAGAAQEIAHIKAEHKTPKKNTKDKGKSSSEGIIMDKVDKFITDRNRIF